MKNKKFFLPIAFFLSLIFIFTGCNKKNEKDTISVAVFVPGIMADSPIYNMLAQGVTSAVEEYNSNVEDEKKVNITILEAGTNQAEWASKITALAASELHDVIISSNPALPDIIAPLTVQFPKQKFIILDAFYEGNKSIATIRYNQREQAYLTGYIAALISTANTEDLPFANPEPKLGFIAAQEYPVMNEILLPSFIEGAKAANPDSSVEFRIVGNWYDAAKGAELAKALYKEGVDVILPICGGASQGVISSAKDLGFYITWFDDNGFSKAPGYIVSSSVMAQERMAKEITLRFLDGSLEFGKAETVGIPEGYVDFVQDDSLYIETVPADIRLKMKNLVNSIKSGQLLLPSP